MSDQITRDQLADIITGIGNEATAMFDKLAEGREVRIRVGSEGLAWMIESLAVIGTLAGMVEDHERTIVGVTQALNGE